MPAEDLKSGDNTLGTVLEVAPAESGSASAPQVEAGSAEPVPEQVVESKGEAETGKLSEILQKTALVSAQASAAMRDDVHDDARNLSLFGDTESQVTRLLDLVMQKGVLHGVNVARKMKNYYLLDRMHDELVDKFYQGLVEKGMIERE